MRFGRDDLVRILGDQADKTVADAFDGGCADVVSRKIALQQGNMLDLVRHVCRLSKEAEKELTELRDTLWEIGEQGDTFYLDDY